MKQLIKVPAAGESVTHATIGEWQKKDGDDVRQNDVLVTMETDKASMDLTAEASGRLKILKKEGEEVPVGTVIAELAAVAGPRRHDAAAASRRRHDAADPSIIVTPSHESAAGRHRHDAADPSTIVTSPDTAVAGPHEHSIKNFVISQNHKSADSDAEKNTALHQKALSPDQLFSKNDTAPNRVHLSPAVRRLVAEGNMDVSKIAGTGPGGRITKADVLDYNEKASLVTKPEVSTKFSGQPVAGGVQRGVRRERMNTIRRRIAERLVESQQNSATLTTFNELDMSRVMAIRKEYKETFQKKHGVKLGFMSFFIKAVVCAVQKFPKLNAFIDGGDIVYNEGLHIGVAVSTKRGLVVPVLRYAEQQGMAELEKAVLAYAEKARDGKIQPDDLIGGTFTISNGGVFGSLMSTPILNPPQSGILGLHKIEDRPVAIDGKVLIRPLMYAALSYDHRLVDGSESVGFLRTIKECIEDPVRLLIDL